VEIHHEVFFGVFFGVFFWFLVFISFGFFWVVFLVVYAATLENRQGLFAWLGSKPDGLVLVWVGCWTEKEGG